MSNKDGGWSLPEIIDPPRRCICIPVPDEPFHRQAFFGALNELGWQHNWQRDPEHKAMPTSIVWNTIIREAMGRFYSLEEYMCFTCEQLQECLAPLLEAQSLQIQQMINQSKYGDPNPIGQPLPTETTAGNLAEGSNPTCNLDITWAQCWQIVTYTDILITDALELAESATNDVELAQVISSIPGLDELGVDAIFGYIELLLEGIQDNYFAQVTEAYLQELACAIFCESQDCSITIDRIRQVLHARLAAHFGDLPSAFATITDLMAYFVDSDIDGTIIADVLFYIVWEGGALANTFLGDVGTKSIATLLQLAVNDANNDWETICEECPAAWTRSVDLTAFDGGLDILNSFGTWVDGVGWVGDCENDGNFYLAVVAQIEFAAPATITGAQVTYTVAGYEGDPTADRVWLTDDTVPNWAATRSGANGTDIELGYEDDSDIVDVVGFTVHAGNVAGTCPTGSVVATRFEVSGFGDVPPELETDGWE